MLDKLTKLLNIEGKQNKIDLLAIIIDLTTQQILAYINENYLPESLEWIVIKVAQREFNMNNSTHLISEGIDVISSSFKQGDLLADFIPYLNAYIENKAEEKPNSYVRRAKFY